MVSKEVYCESAHVIPELRSAAQVGALILAILAYLLPHSVGAQAREAGCTKDTDCKGERVCVESACGDPMGKTYVATPTTEVRTEGSTYAGTTEGTIQAQAAPARPNTEIEASTAGGATATIPTAAMFAALSPHDLTFMLAYHFSQPGLLEGGVGAGLIAGIGLRLSPAYVLQTVAAGDLIMDGGLQMAFGVGLRNDGGDDVGANDHYFRGMVGAAPLLLEREIVDTGVQLRMDFGYRTSEHTHVGFGFSATAFGGDAVIYALGLTVGV